MSSMLASVANTERRASAVIGSRDVPVSTVVHLMGLPTASQLSLLEGKIDVLTSKIGTITAKIERLSSEVSLLKSDATIDRIDFQLNDLRGLLRRLVPKATAAGEIETAPEAAIAATAPKPKVLSSAPAAKPKAASEPDALEEFDNDAGAFQAAEGRRVRQETK